MNLCNTDNPEELPEGILLQTKNFMWEFVQANILVWSVKTVGNK